MSNEIILYDLPTKKPEYGCWSPNVWKTRLVLNYKKIPYKTVWLKHSEITPTLSSVGLQPNVPHPNGPPSSPYTLPAVRLPDGTYVMDSAIIAPKLEDLFPEPSLRLDTELHVKAQMLLGQAAAPLLGVIFPRIGRDILLDETYPAWKADKEKKFGVSLEEFERVKGGEGAWKAAEPGIKALGEFVRGSKVDIGPFLLGSQVCYGDFVIAGMLESLRRTGKDIYERVVGFDEGLRKLHEGVKAMRLFEKDD